jgi:hypothetical protein
LKDFEKFMHNFVKLQNSVRYFVSTLTTVYSEYRSQQGSKYSQILGWGVNPSFIEKSANFLPPKWSMNSGSSKLFENLLNIGRMWLFFS